MMFLLQVLHVGYVLSDLAYLLLALAVLRLVHRHLVDQLVGLSLHLLDQIIGLTLVVLGQVDLRRHFVVSYSVVVMVEELSTLSN